MTTITLSSNPSIRAWETAIDNSGVESNLSGVTLKGHDAAAYLFARAIASYTGNAATVTIQRSDAVFEFPADSGNLASITEIADALRYKYGVDPLIEFSSRYGVPSYTVADLNAILTEMNRDFAGKFSLEKIDLAPLALGDYEIDTRPLTAKLEDLIDAEGRAALLSLAESLHGSLSDDSSLRDDVARGEVDMSDAVFDGQSLRQLLATAQETLGTALDTLMPDAFYAGRFSLATINTLLAAATEANPDEGVNLTALSSSVTPGSYQSARADWLADIRRGLRVAYAEISGFDASAQSDDVRSSLGALADALAGYAATDAGISRLSAAGFLDPDAAEISFSGQRVSFNALLEELGLQDYVASVLPHLDTQGLTLRDVNKLLATARDLDPASAEQWPTVDPLIRATGDDGRTYTGAQALVQRLATALNQWLTQTIGTEDDASQVPLDREAAVLPDPLAPEGSDARLSIDQWSSLCQQALGTDPFEGIENWYRADILTLRDALYAQLPSAQLPEEAAPQPLDQAALASFINRLVPATPPLAGQTILASTALFEGDQGAVSLNSLLTADAPIQSLLSSLGLFNGNQVSISGLKQLLVWSQTNLDGITADPEAFEPDAPNGPNLSAADIKAQVGQAVASRESVQGLMARMQAFAAESAADWDAFCADLQAQLSQAPEAVDGTALQALTAQSLPSLEDFRTWVNGASQHALAVVEQYDRTVEALNASLGSTDLQAASRAALTQTLTTVQDRHDRFVEAFGVLSSLATSATSRESLWDGLDTLSSDPYAVSLLVQIPADGDDLLQMLRRFDVPAEATSTYRTALADAAPEVLDLEAAQAVSVPVVTPVSWQDSMQDTLSVMTQLRSRMADLASDNAWGFDIGFLRNRAQFNQSTAAGDNAAADRMQVWYDDVTTYVGMLDQLLAVQSDPSQFGDLLAQFKQQRGTKDLLGDMGYYSLPHAIGGFDWWTATGIPFRSNSSGYSFLDIDLWNSNLDYSAFFISSGTRVGALPDISDATVTEAMASNQQAQRVLASTDAGVQSLVDGTSILGSVNFVAIADDINAGLNRTLDALNSSIGNLQALQAAQEYLTEAGQAFTLFASDEGQVMADRLTVLLAQRDAVTAASSALATLTALGASPSPADFSAALNEARDTLFPSGDGTEDVMAQICSYALTVDQLDQSHDTLALHSQTFDPGAWRSAADFSGNSYTVPDLNPHGAFDQDTALEDFRTWGNAVSAHALVVIEQYDRSVEAINETLASSDLQASSRTALEQMLATVHDRQDRFLEARGVMLQLLSAASDRHTLWDGLNTVATDPYVLSLLSQISDADGDVLQMLRRFDVPTEATATYRPTVVDIAPEVLDLETAQAVPVPETTPVSWQDDMQDTLDVMISLRARMREIGSIWSQDIVQLTNRAQWDPAYAQDYNDARARIQGWLDDVTSYADMLDQLLAVQSDPIQFGALLEQFEQESGTSDLLGDMGYYCLPRYIRNTYNINVDWWQSDMPFKSSVGGYGGYAFLDIDRWNNEELDYSSVNAGSGLRVGALPDISDASVTQALAPVQQAQRALAVTDAGAQSLVDGTSLLGTVNFEFIADDIAAGLVRTREALSSSIAQLQALQLADAYLVEADQSFTLFDTADTQSVADELAALIAQRDALDDASTALAELAALGANPSSADFSAALAEVRAVLFPNGAGAEDVMALICSYALTADQLEGGSVTLALRAQTFDPGAWRSAADFSGSSYHTPDLDPEGLLGQNAWAEALQGLQDQLDVLPAAADLLARLSVPDASIDLALERRSQEGLSELSDALRTAMLRTDLATTDIPTDLRASWVGFVNDLGQLTDSSFEPDGVIDIDADLFGPIVNGQKTRSLRDLLTAMQVDDDINAMSFMSAMGIVVDNRWASRDGLNRLIEVLAAELPEDVDTEPFAAIDRVSPQDDDGSALADVSAVVQYVQRSLRGLDDTGVFSTVQGVPEAVRTTDKVLVDPDAPSERISLETLRLRVSMRWGVDPFALMSDPGRTVITAQELNGWKALMHFSAQAMTEDPHATADTAPWYDPVSTGGVPLTEIDPALVTQAQDALAQITSTDFAIGALDINAPLMRDASGDRLCLRDLLERLGVMDTLRARGVVMDHYITAAGFNRMTQALGSLFPDLDVDTVDDPLDSIDFDYLGTPITVTGSRAGLYTAVRVIGSLEGSLSSFSTLGGVPDALATDAAVFDDPSSTGAKVSLDTLRERLLAGTGFDLFATFSTNATSLGHGSGVVTAQELNGLIALATFLFDTSRSNSDTAGALKRVQNWSVQDIENGNLREVGRSESFDRFSGVFDDSGEHRTINEQLATLFKTPPVAYDPEYAPGDYSVENFAGRITIANAESVLRSGAALVEAPEEPDNGGQNFLEDPQYKYEMTLNYWGQFAVTQGVFLAADTSTGVLPQYIVEHLTNTFVDVNSQLPNYMSDYAAVLAPVEPALVDAGGLAALFGGTLPSPMTFNHAYGLLEAIKAYRNGNVVYTILPLSSLQSAYDWLDNTPYNQNPLPTWGFNSQTIESIKNQVLPRLGTLYTSVANWLPPAPPPAPPQLSNWAQALVDAGGRYETALDAGPGAAVMASGLAAQSADLNAQVADLNALSLRFAQFAGLDSDQRTDQWPAWRDATDALLDTMAIDWDVSRSDLLDDVLPDSWAGTLADLADGETPELTALRSARADIDQARDRLNRQLLTLQARVTDDAAALADALETVRVRSATSPYENLMSDLMKGLQSLGEEQFDDDGQLLATATLTGPRGQILSFSEFLAELQTDAPDDVRTALEDGGGLSALAGQDIDLANFSLTARDQWVSALVQAIPSLADQLTLTPVTGSAVTAIAGRVTQQSDAVRSGMDEMALWWEQVQAWAGQGLNTRTGLVANPAVDESELGYLYDTVGSDYDAADPDTWYADRAGGSLWGRVRLAMQGLTQEPNANGADADAWRSNFYASIRQMVTVLGGARDRADFVRTESLDQFHDAVQNVSAQQPFVDALTEITEAWASGSDTTKRSTSEWNSFRNLLQTSLDTMPLSPQALGLDTSLLDAVLDTNAPPVTSTMTRNWLTGMNTRVDLVLTNLYSSSTRLIALQCPDGVDSAAFAAAKGQEISALQKVIDRFQKVATVLDQIGTDAFDLSLSKTQVKALGDPDVTDLLAYLWRADVSPEFLSQYRTDGALRLDGIGNALATYSNGYFDFNAWQSAVIDERQSPYQDSQLSQGPTVFEQLQSFMLDRQQSLHDAMLQAQAKLNFSAADIGDALSRLQRVEAPTGYDGLWYQLALALQNISADDLGSQGVSLDVPILPHPPGSTTLISFNDLWAQLEAGMPEGKTLMQCLSEVPGFSLGNAQDPVLDAASRQDLLAAIYSALPSVATALSGYPVPGGDSNLMAFAAVSTPKDEISSRIAAQRTLLLETPRVLAQPPATELEIREMLTEGADLYVDRSGAFYIQGIRTTARDLSITSRMLVQDKLSLEYKRLMDGMSERNNLIAAARDTLTTISNATGNDSADRLTLYSALYVKQQQLGFSDLLSEMTAGQFTMDQLFQTPALQSNNGDLSAGHRPTLQDLTTYLGEVRDTITATRNFYQERIDASQARAEFYAGYGNTYTAQQATLYSRQQNWDGYVDDANDALDLADQLQTLVDDSADPIEFATALAALESTTGQSNLIGSLADFAMPSDIYSYGQLPPDDHADWVAGRLWGDDNTIRVWDGSQSRYRDVTVDWSSATLGLTPNTPDATLVFNALGTYEDSLWTVDAVKWKLGELDGPTQSFGLETYFYDVTGRTGLLDVYGDPVRGHKYVAGIYSDEMWKQDADIDSFGATQRSSLSALLNTLISNKIRDGDLDQAKLQALTGQLQNNIELMSALLKAFNELTTNLARAL